MLWYWWQDEVRAVYTEKLLVQCIDVMYWAVMKTPSQSKPPNRKTTSKAKRAAVVKRDETYLSVVFPVFNEEESLPILFDNITAALKDFDRPWEIIAINDGSDDKSYEVLRELAEKFDNVRIVNFRRNYGQTAAMMAGFNHAQGEVIVTLDSDLQNDPQDIPMLVEKMQEGYDVVSGWRKDRKDAKLTRNLPSFLANALISKISGVKLNDYGCTLKAYRKEIMTDVRLYGEMHRFIPIYASWMGAKVVEMPVRHHSRQFGSSKYGLNRIFKVILDLIVVKFLQEYLVKPIYLFGGFAIITIMTAFGILAGSLILKFFYGTSLIQTPLPLLATMFFLIGCISILLGLLAEMNMRTYFETHGRQTYTIKPEPRQSKQGGNDRA